MIVQNLVNSITNVFTNSRAFLVMLGLSFLVALVFANTRLVNETIAWLEKEESLYKSKKYLKYGILVVVRWMCMILFFTTGKDIYNTIKTWRENGKITF
jgi:hypothetical protein